MAMPWVRMRCVCDDCNIRLIPTVTVYGGKLRHFLEITEQPRIVLARIMFAWVLYCLGRTFCELANIWRLRKPFEDPLGIWDE